MRSYDDWKCTPPPESDEPDHEEELPVLTCNTCGGNEHGWRAKVCVYCGEGVMGIWDDEP